MKKLLLIPYLVFVVISCGKKTNPSSHWIGNMGSFESHLTMNDSEAILTIINSDEKGYLQLKPESDSLLGSFSTLESPENFLSASVRDSLIQGFVVYNNDTLLLNLHRIVPWDNQKTNQTTGWYEMNGDTMLFSHGAYGGLRFFDFENISAGTRYPASDFQLFKLESDGSITKGYSLIQDRIDQPIIKWNSDTLSAIKIENPPYSVEEVHFRNGDIELSGVLMVPQSEGSFPAVVYAHGSGANNTRDDFHDMYMLNELVKQNIAVLIPDKRGSGKSEGRWQTASFDDLAEDMVAGVDYLATRNDLNIKNIGVFGFSQGGWIAPIAATKSNNISFVINTSGAMVPPLEQLDHELRNTFSSLDLTENEFNEIMALFDELTAYIENPNEENWRAYKQSLEIGLNASWAEIAETFYQERDYWRLGWWITNKKYDPSLYWSSLDIPSLIIYGEEDEYNNVPVKKSTSIIENLDKTNIEYQIYSESGHAMGDPIPGGYVRKDFLREMANWIKSKSM